MVRNLISNYPTSRLLTIRLIFFFLIIATFSVYWPVTNHTFLNYDDQAYITENPHVQGGLSLNSMVWSLFTIHASNWHPLTWISHMLDVQLFGMHPGMHHLISLLFHIFNTLLLFHVLKKSTGDIWPSALVAALFALHPLHVESVAWLAERKNVLSSFFWMMTLYAYIRYVERSSSLRYLLVLVFFALGLMAKPMLVTMPFVLLLTDYWPLGRIVNISAGFRLFFEKIPMLILSILSCAVTIYAQQGSGAIKQLEVYPVGIRIANAVVSYVTYMNKMIWPQNMTAFYPYNGHTLSAWQVLFATLIIFTISFMVWAGHRRYPHLLVGWLWYLGTLIPVIGLVQVGAQAYADRYTYIPLIGLFLIISWSIPLKRIRPAVLIPIIIVLISALLFQTRSQVKHWRDDLTLFKHMLEVTERNYRGHNGLGFALANQGLLDQAVMHFREAIRIRSDYDRAYNNLGVALLKTGDARGAAYQIRQALQYNSANAKAHNNLGVALMELGKTEQAISHIKRAIALNPGYREARQNLVTAQRK